MKSIETMRRGGAGVAMRALAVTLGLAWGATPAPGQTARILFRPLTPQEIKTHGMTNITQKSGGGANVGLGQPVYMEALVQTGGVVSSVSWSIIGAPPGSAAALTVGFPSNSVPTYEPGDRRDTFVASRAMLRPDLVCFFDFGTTNIVDYKVRTSIVLTNKTLVFTNSAFGSVYLGQKHYLCVLCHADKQASFDQTDHATAFTRQISGTGSDHFSSNCISCHSLGFDKTAGAANDGFDDVAASLGWTFPATLSSTNWSAMPAALQQKSNVQCENCHGAASTHMVSLGRTNAIDVSLSAGTCGQCHDSLPHHVKPYEWVQSLHATGYVFRFSGSCLPCHSAKGFIETNDPYFAASGKVPRSGEQEGISCTACHDPHNVGMGEHQLRLITNATLLSGDVITHAQAGDGVLCMNCHHARENAEPYVLGWTSGRFSPHHGTQGDMVAGKNAIEYGLDMPSSRHMTAVSNSCVGCHMQLIATTSYSNQNTRVGGHTFKLTFDNGTSDPSDDVRVTEVCSVCHVEQGTFDFGGEDYDRDGTVEGVQTEIRGLLDQLGNLLPPAGTNVTATADYSLSQKKAAYNYLFVAEDKSLGVHNPKYAAAILRASIDDLTGGIDVDRDGLLDAWEMANFGNLTSQTGQGDADGDGVSNELEQQLGLNPNSSDSDNDGYSDLAELQGGSNPLDFASTLPPNFILSMLPAIELAYLPGEMGVTQRFESVDSMGTGGGWAPAGLPFVSSNAFFYQLISLRDATQRYYRVVKP